MSEEKKAKRSIGKLIVKILIWVAIVLVAVGLIVLWQIDRIAATGTRTVGSMLTGTKVDVSSISISPFAGVVKVKKFTVGNPEGFLKPNAIQVGNLHIDAGMTSLLSDKVVVEHLEVTGVAIDFEYKFGTGSNLDVILKNVEKATGADKKAAEEKKEAPAAKEKSAAQKQVVIKKLIFRDSKVTVSSGMMKTSMVIPLIPIEMENIGEGKDLAGTISEIMTRLITEIGKVVNFDKLGKSLSETGEDIVQGLDKATDSVGGAVVSAGDSAGKALDKTLDKTKKLLRGLPGLGK